MCAVPTDFLVVASSSRLLTTNWSPWLGGFSSPPWGPTSTKVRFPSFWRSVIVDARWAVPVAEAPALWA